MNKICGACGAPVPESAGFCGSCGVSAQQGASRSLQAEYQPVAQPVAASPTPQPEFQPVAQSAAPSALSPAVSAARSSSPWLKVLLVTFAIVFVCGAVVVGGIVYVAHKVSEKAHEYSREVLEETASTTPAGGSQGVANPAGISAAFASDPCRLLSKQDVSQAIGIPIVETSPADGGCSYLARGTATDMAAKHAAAMMATNGADKKTQGIFEQFAGGVLKSVPKSATTDTESADGNVVVFTFGIDTNSAREQMHLNAKVLGGLGSAAQQPIDGIGDEAFAEADSMIMVRKGDKLIRIFYMSCPCNTDAIKPLAKQLAARL
jgi:hypothetical protein